MDEKIKRASIITYSSTFDETVKEFYNKYVLHYNSSSSQISVLAELTSVEKKLEQHLDSLKSSLEETIYKFKSNLKYVSLNSSQETKSNNLHIDISHRKKQITSVIDACETVYNSFQSQYQLMRRIKILLNGLAKVGKKNCSHFNAICYLLEIIFEDLFKVAMTEANLKALSNVQNKIIDSGYIKELEVYDELSEDEKEKITKEKSSNNHKLYKSFHWMNDAVDKLVKCESESQILSCLKNIDESFEKPDPNRSLYMGTGRVNNGAVAECLVTIHNKRYPSDTVKEKTIKEHYPELSMD